MCINISADLYQYRKNHDIGQLLLIKPHNKL